jgi:hypothetical protein
VSTRTQPGKIPRLHTPPGRADVRHQTDPFRAIASVTGAAVAARSRLGDRGPSRLAPGAPSYWRGAGACLRTGRGVPSLLRGSSGQRRCAAPCVRERQADAHGLCSYGCCYTPRAAAPRGTPEMMLRAVGQAGRGRPGACSVANPASAPVACGASCWTDATQPAWDWGAAWRFFGRPDRGCVVICGRGERARFRRRAPPPVRGRGD